MSIQSNVNKMLSIGALLASQNPALKAQAEARAKSTQLSKQRENLQKQIDVAKGHGKAGKEIKSGAEIEMAKIAEEEYKLDPSDKTFKELIQRKKASQKAKLYLKSKQDEKKEVREATKPIYTDLKEHLESMKETKK